MALRAMYKGFKKVLAPLIINRPGELAIDQDALNTELNTVFFPRSEQAVLGAKNLLPNNLVNETRNGVTVTVNADGSTEFDTGGSTASAATSFKFYSAKGSDLQHLNGKIFSGLTNGVSGKYSLRISMRNSPWTTYISVITEPVTISGIPNTNDVIDIDMFVYSGATLDHVVVYPMISFDGGVYVPYAMTNKELTDEVASLKGSASDQKTAINAIITAATGAADFAAFQTAMGAITPVTRSIQVTPETREEIIEPVEEPEVKKTTTRKKSTAKADTEKEGE